MARRGYCWSQRSILLMLLVRVMIHSGFTMTVSLTVISLFGCCVTWSIPYQESHHLFSHEEWSSNGTRNVKFTASGKLGRSIR